METYLMTNFSFMLQGNLIVHFTMFSPCHQLIASCMGFEWKFWKFFQINFVPTFFEQFFGIFILRNQILTYTKDSSF